MSKYTILCVDDERNVLLTLRSQLIRCFPDCKIEIAESGSEALEVLKKCFSNSKEIALVIVDQIMPMMKGDELLIEIHSRYPAIIKVMLTGQASAEEVGNVVNRAELYRFISKPWNEIDLQMTVTEALRRYQQDQLIAQQRRALEDNLQQSQHFIKRITESIPNLLYIFDIDEQSNVYANYATKKLFGYSVEEASRLEFRAFSDNCHPDDHHKFYESLQSCSNLEDGEFLETEYRIKDTQGQWRWILSHHTVFLRAEDLRQRLNASGMTEELIDTVYGIGYRLKVSPQTLLAQPLVEMLKVATEGKIPVKVLVNNALSTNKAPENKFSDGIAKIKERFDASLEERMKVLLEAERSLQQGKLTSDQRIAAKDDIHRLAGTLGTFGYPEASEIAKGLESLLIGTNLLTESEIIRINQLILKLGKVIAKSSDPVTLAVLSESLKPIVLFLGEDLKFADALYLEAIANGFRFKMLEPANLKENLEEWITKDTISVVLIALNPKDLESEHLLQLSILKQYFPSIPVLILANHTNHDPQDILRERVEVARRGGDRYLLQPIALNEIFVIVNQLIIQMRSQSLAISETEKAKIMVVDDDPIILEFLTNLLQPWGLQVTCLGNSLEFWEVLTATQPDLLILDLEMPTFKGIELCQVIRSDPQWISLPILMITARQEAEIIAQAFAAGCDDFVRKPIIEPELIARIIKHLEPSRIRQKSLIQRRLKSGP